MLKSWLPGPTIHTSRTRQAGILRVQEAGDIPGWSLTYTAQPPTARAAACPRHASRVRLVARAMSA
eukprot:3022860-Rhodomonas_salina.3